MIARARAREAKKAGDLAWVISHLEGYNQLAERHHAHCIKIVNQAPPPYTKTDQRLLQTAKDKLDSDGGR